MDPIIGGALISGAMSGGLSYLGANEQNNAARGAFDAQTQQNQILSREQRDWQSSMASWANSQNAEMSNTAYQRAMADMQKAGLNPMLAYQQGGAGGGTASAGSGSAASAGSAPPVANKMSGLAASAGEMQRNIAAIQNLKQDTDTKRSQSIKAISDSNVNNEVENTEVAKQALYKMQTLNEANTAKKFQIETPAIKSRSQLDKDSNELDKKTLPYEKGLNMLGSAVSSALGTSKAGVAVKGIQAFGSKSYNPETEFKGSKKTGEIY